MAGAAFDSEQAGYVSVIDEIIKPAWIELVQLVERIGGYGPARLAIRVVGAGPPDEYTGGSSLLGRLERNIDVTRPIELAPPTDDQLGSIHRELQRATGLFTWEPEDQPADD